MKIREDFVTNSSSSSFIIAKRKDCTLEDIQECLQEKREEARRLLLDWDAEDVSVDSLLLAVAGEIFYSGDLGLDNWEVASEIYSDDDDGSLARCFLYVYGDGLGNDKFKVKCAW